jgi:hypothetical protein
LVLDASHANSGSANVPEWGQKLADFLEKSHTKTEKEPKHKHVDLMALLPNINLDYLHHSCRPDGERVDELSAEISKQREKGVEWPSVYAKLEKFLPSWCDNFAGTTDEHDDSTETVLEMRKALGFKQKIKKSLNLLQWITAFDAYAISAAALDQWCYTSALTHRSNCIRIAYNSLREKRRHSLAVFYDELARQKWSRCAYSGDPAFKIDYASLRIDDEVLKEAREKYDEAEMKPPADKVTDASVSSSNRGWKRYGSSWDTRGAPPKKPRR